MYEVRQNKEKVSRTIVPHSIRHSETKSMTLWNLDKKYGIKYSVMQMALNGKWFEQLNSETKQVLISLESHPVDKLLSNEQRRAFSAYVGGSYENMNAYLRTKKEERRNLKRYQGSVGVLNMSNDIKNISNMKSAFSQALPIPSEITVYRGCGRFITDSLGNNLLAGDVNSLKGKEIVEPAFLSTSANINHAKKFILSALLIITVPAGIRAFYVTKELENRTASGKLRDEDEIIFGPGMKMRIDKVIVQNSKLQSLPQKVLLLYVTMIPQSSMVNDLSKEEYNAAPIAPQPSHLKNKESLLPKNQKRLAKIIVKPVPNNKMGKKSLWGNRSNKKKSRLVMLYK